MSSRTAYLSLLSTENFLPGALVLHYSLQQTRPEHPFVLLVTENISADARRLLETLNIATHDIASEGVPGGLPVAVDKHMPHWEHTFSKLQILRQTQFDKIVFVDADMLVCKTLDGLFSKPGWSAVSAGAMLPEKAHWGQLNSGLMVIEPSETAYEDLVACVMKCGGSIGSDQDCFHAFLPDWPARQSLHLDHKYNMFANLFARYRELFGYRILSSTQISDEEAKDEKLVHILHFVGPLKPWGLVHDASRDRPTPRPNNAVRLWSAFYLEMCDAYGLDPKQL